MGPLMPIHDWSRVDMGVFHDFHVAWMGILVSRLNSALLPPDYFGLLEQTEDVTMSSEFTGTPEKEARYYTARQRRLVVRHTSSERAIAIVEIVSAANKSSGHAFNVFLGKVLSTLEKKVHLLLIDLQPRSVGDPKGIHVALWQALTDEETHLPADQDRTLAAYVSGSKLTAFIEPIAVGQSLLPMPLFLTQDRYVNVPLEETYQAAYEGVPRIYRRVLEG